MIAQPTDLSQLSREEKLALLARLARERARAKEDAGGPRVYPLAFAQLRFWFLDQLEPGSYLENIFRALRLRGDLDRPALERALRELARRHDALRTHFPVEGGEPLQVVEPELPGGPLELDLIDLSGLPASEAEPRAVARAGGGAPASEAGPRAVALAGEESRRPFDLARGPLFRARLLRLGARDHVLLLGL